MLLQRLIIRLLPLEVTLFSLGAGWLIIQVMLGVMAPAPVAAPPITIEPLTPAPTSVIAPLFTREVQHWASKIAEWAAAQQLDPNLVSTVMQIESCGAPGAVSGSGAQGLFQVMPFHFAEGEAMQDPDTNALRGLSYLSLGLTRAGGDAGLALAGYNGGHSQIGKDSALWPAQTKRYWYWGTGIYADAVSGQATSTRLQEWLDAGGASLCQRAGQELGLP